MAMSGKRGADPKADGRNDAAGCAEKNTRARTFIPQNSFHLQLLSVPGAILPRGPFAQQNRCVDYDINGDDQPGQQ